MKTDSSSNGKINWFARGMKDGVPISMGYFAVAFTLGITARKSGMTTMQAGLMSALMLASAGEFAAMTCIATGAGVTEIIITQIVVNLRYLLMSSALSQKITSKVTLKERLLMAYGVTDEIFGISVGVEGKLNPLYQYGAICVASPGWVAGTVLGALVGQILPARVMSALNVALYGMFLAVVIPASRKSKIVALVVVLSMVCSLLFTIIPGLKEISSGFQIIILTIVLSAAAAYAFPIKEEN